MHENLTEAGRTLQSLRRWHMRTCAWCGEAFRTQIAKARFCREAHRKAATRERIREEELASARA